MPEQLISRPKLKRLHTLWGMFCRRAQIDPQDRAARLGWLTGAVGRPVQSSKELTRAEADLALSAIQAYLPPEMVRHTRPSRERARAYGTAGRKNTQGGKTIDLIDKPTWKLLEELMHVLGWDRARLDAFVVSQHGPKRLVTMGDANKVIWAFKQMLRRKAKSGTAIEKHGEILEEAIAR